MMDNLTRQALNYGVSPPQGAGYDVEFYNSPPDSTPGSGGSLRGWKEHHNQPLLHPHNSGGHLNNNNNISPGGQHGQLQHDVPEPRHLHHHGVGGFAISVSTGESELFIDELIELADENNISSATSCSSSTSAMSTPSPVLLNPHHPQSSTTNKPLSAKVTSLSTNNIGSSPFILKELPTTTTTPMRPLSSTATTTLPFHSRLHEALTQPQNHPRLPTQPVKCHRCGYELTSRCLMQTCMDDARCRTCGLELTTKCILAVCTVQPNEAGGSGSGGVPDLSSCGGPPPRKRVHHYSTPS